MTKAIINKTSLQISSRETLATGNVNSLSVGFRFLDGWDNLAKTAIFKNGSSSVSVLLSSDICSIPWEVLQSAGELYVSLRGTNSGGELVLCTENAFIGTVKPSLAASIAAQHHEATPDILDALLSDVADLKNGTGAGGANGKSAYELALEGGFEGSLAEWLDSLKGSDGADGRNGADGYTPVKGTDYFTASDKAELIGAVLNALPDGDEVSY